MEQKEVTIMIETISLTIIGLIIAGFFFDPGRRLKQTRKFLWMCLLSAAAIIFDIASWLMMGKPQIGTLLAIIIAVASVIGFCASALLPWVVDSLVHPQNKGRVLMCWIITAAFAFNAVLFCVGIPTGWAFHVTDGIYYPGSAYMAYYLVPAVAVVISTIMAMRADNLIVAEKLAFGAIAIFYVSSLGIELMMPGSGANFAAAALSVLEIYIGIFVHRSRQLAETEAELSRKRMSVMVSQMQPHFLLNSLTTIMDLCDRDPKMAKRAISNFSDYLRGNLDAMTGDKLIPFNKELDHCKTYLSFEKLRFEDAIEIVYDIDFTDFTVPALSVQPLLENAVKHGVGHKMDGGMVMLSVKRRNGNIEIKVLDDGVGFDMDAPLAEGRSHVGIENVRSRLQTMCGGTLRVSSTPGSGTTAVITIPEDDDK